MTDKPEVDTSASPNASPRKIHPDLWNTGTNLIHNESPWGLVMNDGEARGYHNVYNPGQTAVFRDSAGDTSARLPWCINSSEVTTKAFHVFAAPSNPVSTYLVAVFQDYRDDQLYYLPYGESWGQKVFCQEGPCSWCDIYFTAAPGTETKAAPGPNDIVVRAQAIS